MASNIPTKKLIASNISLSLPSHDSTVPPLCDMATVSHPLNQNSSKTALKFRLKFNPNHLSIPKVADGSETSPTCSDQKSLKISDCPFVDEKTNGSPVSKTSQKKSPKIKFRVKRSNISIPSSIVKEVDAGSIVAGEINVTEPNTPACKEESLLMVAQASIDDAAVANKNQKKRLFSVTLPRQKILEDVAAIEARSGGKRLRRPRKRDPPRSAADQRRLDRLFPGFEYLGFH
ncbi:hypothetical protein V6N13_148458 [Hibiscus sabdariffa]|uniref:Uncharacterized protein n=1 Tax=Hibiscus sabdariffa TaxID=183260 RepID=A0ABR2TZ53_9ROSI